MAPDKRDEPSYIISLGPVSLLRVGIVWVLDLTPTFGLWGIGWRKIGWRRIEP